MRTLSPLAQSLLLLAVLVTSFLLFTDIAYAQADGSVGSFRCVGGKAVGQLYVSNDAPTTLTMSNIFSFLIGNMEQLSSNLMGHMFCGLGKSLEPVVWGAATLATVFFGIAFTIGVVPATGRDAIVFLLKIAFITGFATSADLLIGVGYKFLIVGMQEGVTIVLKALGGEYKTGKDVYGALDGFLNTAIHFATDSVKTVDPTLSPEAAEAARLTAKCKNALFAVLATLTVAFPLLAYIGILLLARIAITFVRAVFAYVYALVGITFLLALAPFFLSFALFKATTRFFEKWLGYMISFAFQVVLLFAFLGFILSLPVSQFSSNISDMIMPKQETRETTSFRFPWEYCTICEFDIVDKNDPTIIFTDANAGDMLSRGKMQCKLKDGKKVPIPITGAFTPQKGSKEISGLMLFAGYNLIAMLILAFIVEKLLTLLPQLAQRLSTGVGGVFGAPQLGGGKDSQGQAFLPLPGEARFKDAGDAFRQGMGINPDKTNPLGNGPTSLIQGVRDGLSTLVTGKPLAKGESTGGINMKQILGTLRRDPK
jgi:hypothetical protein